MGGLKTYLLLLAGLLALPTPLLAMTDGPRDRTQVFAACLGRYSAQMEHEWLTGADGESPRSRRALFEMMLETVAETSGFSGPEILDIRIRAKLAQAHLLQIATFHTDPDRQRRAAAAARLAIRPCEALIIA